MISYIYKVVCFVTVVLRGAGDLFKVYKSFACIKYGETRRHSTGPSKDPSKGTFKYN